MKRLFLALMQGLICVVCAMFGASCEDSDTAAFDTIGDLGAETDGNGPDDGLDIDVNQLPFDHMAPPPTYHLPFMSGERYEASTYAGHGAWDFNKSGGDRGEPIIAVASGTVEVINNSCSDAGYIGSPCGGGYGNYVRIDHYGDSYDSVYTHMQRNQIFVAHGQWVEVGQVIGRIGSSGSSSGDHLHFEVKDSSTGAKILPNMIWDGGSGQLDGVAPWTSYTSKNQGKFDSQRNQSGPANIGNQTTVNATRVHALGFSLTYNGGAFGENTLYYEALGCSGGVSCSTYNNTNYAWVVRGGIRASYFSMGGPNSWLGFPTGNEYAWSNGQRQNFRSGYLFWNRSTGQTTAYPY